jgi:hypothetical protein
MIRTIFSIVGRTIKTTGTRFFVHEQNFYVPEFDGGCKMDHFVDILVRNITDLEIQPMVSDIMDGLVKRGKIFREVGLGMPHHHFLIIRTPL